MSKELAKECGEAQSVDQSKSAGEQVVDVNAAFRDGGLAAEKVGNSCNENGAGYEEFYQFAAEVDDVECSESEGDGVAYGESRNKDQHFFPVTNGINGAESDHKKDVIITVPQIEDMIFPN